MVSGVFCLLPFEFWYDYEGSFMGMGGQVGLCAMGSFINFDRSGKFNYTKKGNCVLSAIVDCEDTGFWLGMGFVCDVPLYV